MHHFDVALPLIDGLLLSGLSRVGRTETLKRLLLRVRNPERSEAIAESCGMTQGDCFRTGVTSFVLRIGKLPVSGQEDAMAGGYHLRVLMGRVVHQVCCDRVSDLPRLSWLRPATSHRQVQAGD